MPKQKELFYKHLLPAVEDMEVQFLLKSENTMWYDAESIIPGYQDSMGDPVGFRPNSIQHELIDLAVPGGWKTLFAQKGRFNFPFGTGGADNSDNLIKINFWSAPRVNGKVIPVVYWILNFTRWRWLFPVGTSIGEILIVKLPDSSQKVVEIRVRKRLITGWVNKVFRPFPTALVLAERVKEKRPLWFQEPKLRDLISHLENNQTLQNRSLSTKSYPGTFETVSGKIDVLPDFGEMSLVKDVLDNQSFQNVMNTPWKADGVNSTYAASSDSSYSIVPRKYDAGLFPVDDISCRRCHKDAGRQIGDFHFNLILYGELWGEDEIFSWHPFENSSFVDALGNVKNFNDNNRKLRVDFVNAKLIERYQPNLHPQTIYKEIPRDWQYHPVRYGKDY